MQTFQEGQYFIPLWTAHLILDYGQPNHNLKETCLNKIKDYIDNPFAREVEAEEKAWLEKYYAL